MMIVTQILYITITGLPVKPKAFRSRFLSFSPAAHHVFEHALLAISEESTYIDYLMNGASLLTFPFIHAIQQISTRRK